MPPEETTEKTVTTETSPLAKAGEGARSEKPVRPEALGKDYDAYWSDEKGVDFGKLAADHKSLAEFKTAQDAAAASRPKKADDYKLELPKDFEAPQGVKIELDPNDPRLGPARELALKHGWSQEAFADAIAMDAKFRLAEQTQLNERLAEELKALGTDGKARVDAVEAWLTANLGNEHGNAIVPMLFTRLQVEAIEKLIKLTKGKVPDFDGNNREDGDDDANEVSDEEYEKMTPTQRVTYTRGLAAKRAKAA